MSTKLSNTKVTDDLDKSNSGEGVGMKLVLREKERIERKWGFGLREKERIIGNNGNKEYKQLL